MVLKIYQKKKIGPSIPLIYILYFCTILHYPTTPSSFKSWVNPSSPEMTSFTLSCNFDVGSYLPILRYCGSLVLVLNYSLPFLVRSYLPDTLTLGLVVWPVWPLKCEQQ